MDYEKNIIELKNSIEELEEVELIEIYETIKYSISIYANLQKPI